MSDLGEKFVLVQIEGGYAPLLVPWTRVVKIMEGDDRGMLGVLRRDGDDPAIKFHEGDEEAIDELLQVRIIDPRLRVLWNRLASERMELDEHERFRKHATAKR